MCLCEGKGSVPLQDGSIIQWHPCPDSNCKHDKTRVYKEIENLGIAARNMQRELIGS